MIINRKFCLNHSVGFFDNDINMYKDVSSLHIDFRALYLFGILESTGQDPYAFFWSREFLNGFWST